METYRGYTIEPNLDWHANPDKFIAYPTEDGIDHDHDWTGTSWQYCGNCIYASSVEYAKLEIDSKLDEL